MLGHGAMVKNMEAALGFRISSSVATSYSEKCAASHQ